jgi:16S rRNA (uracil1498-N3)-methyltransferase
MHISYIPNIHTDMLILSEEESKHCIKVLRMQVGHILYITNGRGTMAKAQISNAHHKYCEVQIIESTFIEQVVPYRLHIAVSPAKNMDRMEWFIEKATECGIDSITFMQTQNSERSKINIERCNKIAISAMKQSKQWHLPQINDIVPFVDLINNTQAEAKLIAWCKADQHLHIGNSLSALGDAKNYLILIGPEGDFTEQEINLATKQGFDKVSLGRTILRTETAAVFACMALKTLHLG